MVQNLLIGLIKLNQFSIGRGFESHPTHSLGPYSFCQVNQSPSRQRRGFPIAVHTTDDIIQLWKTLLLLPPTKSMLILVGNIPASQL
jgi:hypothetical protein